MRAATALIAALIAGSAANAAAQSGPPTTPPPRPAPPVTAQVVAPNPPVVATPPARRAPLVPAAQRTPTAALSLKAAPAVGPAPTPPHRDTTHTSGRHGTPQTLAGATPPSKANPKFAANASTISKNVVPAGATPPAGTTMRCKDGTYLSGTPSADRCANNGGVATFHPVRTNPDAPRPQPQRKQP